MTTAQTATVQTNPATVSSAPRPRQLLPDEMAQGFSLVDTCKFSIRTMAQAATLARFAASMFRDPARVENGLYELLVNAVEHGCLEIGHDLKTQLLTSGQWSAEIERRQSLPDNRQKNVDVVIARRREGLFIVITDPGPGFDWKSWTSVEPSRAGDTHGRGIARARGMSFDSIAYNSAGNQVAVHVQDKNDLKW